MNQELINLVLASTTANQLSDALTELMAEEGLGGGPVKFIIKGKKRCWIAFYGVQASRASHLTPLKVIGELPKWLAPLGSLTVQPGQTLVARSAPSHGYLEARHPDCAMLGFSNNLVASSCWTMPRHACKSEKQKTDFKRLLDDAAHAQLPTSSIEWRHGSWLPTKTKHRAELLCKLGYGVIVLNSGDGSRLVAPRPRGVAWPREWFTIEARTAEPWVPCVVKSSLLPCATCPTEGEGLESMSFTGAQVQGFRANNDMDVGSVSKSSSSAHFSNSPSSHASEITSMARACWVAIVAHKVVQHPDDIVCRKTEPFAHRAGLLLAHVTMTSSLSCRVAQPRDWLFGAVRRLVQLKDELEHVARSLNMVEGVVLNWNVDAYDAAVGQLRRITLAKGEKPPHACWISLPKQADPAALLGESLWIDEPTRQSQWRMQVVAASAMKSASTELLWPADRSSITWPFATAGRGHHMCLLIRSDGLPVDNGVLGESISLVQQGTLARASSASTTGQPLEPIARNRTLSWLYSNELAHFEPFDFPPPEWLRTLSTQHPGVRRPFCYVSLASLPGGVASWWTKWASVCLALGIMSYTWAAIGDDDDLAAECLHHNLWPRTLLADNCSRPWSKGARTTSWGLFGTPVPSLGTGLPFDKTPWQLMAIVVNGHEPEVDDHRPRMDYDNMPLTAWDAGLRTVNERNLCKVISALAESPDTPVLAAWKDSVAPLKVPSQNDRVV